MTRAYACGTLEYLAQEERMDDNGFIDHPFYEVAATASEYAKQGFYVYQKFTCEWCNNRLTMSEPNAFYKTGQCDRCGKITQIEQRGCNFMLSTLELSI